jgi:hypothetical protein
MEKSVGVSTEAEYLEYDLRSEFKNEFINGQVIPKMGVLKNILPSTST